MRSFSGNKRNRIFFSACTFVVIFLFCGACFASEGGAHDPARITDLYYRILNFSLLVIILFVVVKKANVKEFFANRREGIKKQFERLNSQKDEAENRYQLLEKKLKDFEIEKAGILEQYKAEGKAEKEKIIAEAEERATQLLAQADLTIQQEIQLAKDKLKLYVVNIATGKAQDILVNELKSTDQDILVDEFIERVGKLN